jgi:hypothetical protein
MKADRIGFVYVLANKATPGIIKVGSTTAVPFRRAAELSEASGVPFPHRVEYFVLVADCQEVERRVHVALQSCRVLRSREFFSASPTEAIESIRLHAKACGFFFDGGDQLRQFIGAVNTRLDITDRRRDGDRLDDDGEGDEDET